MRKDHVYLLLYVFFLKTSLFSRVIVFLNRLVPINQCPTESNTSKTLLFCRHAQDLKNSTHIADMMMIWMSAQWSSMRTFQRNILRYICNLPVVPKCERIFNQRSFPKREESWLCFFNSGYIWLGLQSSLILSHVTIHYGEASGKETNKRFQADLATISFPGIIWESTFVVFCFGRLVSS